MLSTATRAEVCVAACADLFRDDGEVLVTTIGTIPAIGARLARLTCAPDLLLHDGGSGLLRDAAPLDGSAAALENRMPLGRLMDVVTGGRRHGVMGANQMDRHGNQNIAAIGPYAAPHRLLAGFRGAPSNTVHHRTSYWIPRHGTRTFTPVVDVVCGVGTDRAAGLRFHALYRVVTDLAVLDFAGPGATLRLRSVHPGVGVQDVLARTGFRLAVDDVTETRVPDDAERRLIARLDPQDLRDAEVPEPAGVAGVAEEGARR